MKKRVLQLMLATSLLCTAGFASAGVCNPTVGTNIAQAAVNNQKMDAANEAAAAEGFLNNIKSSLDTIGCTDAWPTGSIGLSLPSYDDIIRKAKEAAISKACNLARDQVSKVMTKVNNQVSLDTSSIPGLSEIGLGNIGGSISGGTGSSAGVSTSGNVGGSSTSDIWNSISGAMK